MGLIPSNIGFIALNSFLLLPAWQMQWWKYQHNIGIYFKISWHWRKLFDWSKSSNIPIIWSTGLIGACKLHMNQPIKSTIFWIMTHDIGDATILIQTLQNRFFYHVVRIDKSIILNHNIGDDIVGINVFDNVYWIFKYSWLFRKV